MKLLSIMNPKNGININDIAIFIKIVQSGSLVSAANSLNMPASTITRRLKRLEDHIGEKLLHRSTHQFQLTSGGERYFRSYANLVNEFNDISEGLRADNTLLKGPLRVLAPTNISIAYLRPMWSSFLIEHPDIKMEILLNNTNQGIFDNQADIALRIGGQTDERLYQQRLGRVATCFVASPSYLTNQDSPQQVSDLYKHKLIVLHVISNYQINNIHSGQTKVFHPTNVTTVNDVRMIRNLIVDGLGISLLPVSETINDLRSGKLVQVLPDWMGDSRDIYAVWSTGNLLNQRAVVLKKFMEKYMNEDPLLQGELLINKNEDF